MTPVAAIARAAGQGRRHVNKFIIAAAALAALPSSAFAADQTINSTSQQVSLAGKTFGSYNGTLTGENSGGGSNAVTSTRANTTPGDTGSLELHGDRTRYVIGSLYDYANAPSFGIDTLRSLTFDWNVAANTSSQRHAAPVGRVIVADANNARTELVWEYVYNGGKADESSPLDQWLTVGTDALWYANARTGSTGLGSTVLSTFQTNSRADTTGFTTAGGTGAGVIYAGGSQLNQNLVDWTRYFSADARVIGISFGAGSGFGSGFTGFVDNAALTTAGAAGQVVDRLNFEPAATGAVPEPATWAMTILGIGAVGFAMRRRQKVTTRVSYAA